MFGSILYEALIDATGTPALGDVILSAADEQVGVDEVFGYCLEDGLAPQCIASSGRIGSSIARAMLYSDRYHGHDPLAWLAASSEDGGPTRFGRITATDVQNSTYRHDCFERPGLREKISFARRRGGKRYVLSFYRACDREPTAQDALLELSDIIFPVLRKQNELIGDASHVPLLDRIERRLESAYALLTRRERQVAARTMIGMTAEAIALDLNIGGATVLTYRRRAYERYAISSAQAMLLKILV